MGGEHQARLQQFRNHGAGTGCLELGQLAVIAGANKNRHVRVDRAGGLEHIQGDVSLVHGNHQQPGALQANGLQ
ncbi:hypothetical protein D3C85_839830 [compost metagenome]